MKQHKTTGLVTLMPCRKTAVSLALLALITQGTHAQSVGVSSQGVSGGLVIPYADVLSPGTLALTYGNYKEPQLGAPFSTEQNFSLGIGVFPYVEFFGRFAEYTDPVPGSILFTGVRDISANVKVQVPTPWANGPKFAVGMNDISGGAVFFKAAYAVASEQYGPYKFALGYATGKSRTTNQPPTFDGAFGGVNVQLTDNGLSALAEYDGLQKHLGLRWMSTPLESLGNAQFIGNVQRSSGAFDGAGTSVAVNKMSVSLVIPVGGNALGVAKYQPSASQALPPLDDISSASSQTGMRATAQDKLEFLLNALVAVGLERVRVGQYGDAVVIEYENHRYAHNEADALGLVFGLGAEMAPKGTEKIMAVTFKDGLRLYETSVGLNAYRAFLRDGPASHVRDSLSWERSPTAVSDQIKWLNITPGKVSPVRIELKPDLNYTLGTEVGAFDYSLAANVQLTAPLWPGARLYSNYLSPLTNTANMDSGAVFDIYKQRSGVNTVALQQSFWLGNQLLTNVSVGRFHYDTPGVQAESTLFVPGSDDVIKASGALYNQAPGGLAGRDRAFAASYRHMLSPTTWLEAGGQSYSDGSRGPTVQLNRWFGDVAVQLFYRKGGSHQFAGLELSFPLTPRQGMKPGPLFFTGASQYAQSIRTQLTTAGATANLVQPGAVRDLKFANSVDTLSLNAGRASQSYFSGEVYRMRESFFKYVKKS